ncbi:hypothetical protein GIB67_033567 [Kingdonia uniflora]|uniref:FLZ-type domain-containing protein n=1 Tax=Kingdonia uniflora TaxID=39325 RepID=A0A7J7L6E3_9MAGN|nr:hypothetical protein GIB67_033567 [Kingdonia uniflora]
MAGNAYLSSPTGEQKRPSSSFFSSPKFFRSFSVKVSSEAESSMSPTSILDSKPFFNLGSPFWSDRNSSTRLSQEACLDSKHHPWEEKLVGLGSIVDALNGEETNQEVSEPDNSRKVLFGSYLKIQIPTIPPYLPSPTESPKSPADFGIKTRISQLGSSSFRSVSSGIELPVPPRVFTGCLSKREMELSEDYTCVVTHGPNPITTHIYGDCIVGNCRGVFASIGDNIFSSNHPVGYPSGRFLSLCYNCKKNLEQGKDIYMYRGEKAFCSDECRNKEILFDAGMA